MKRVQFFGWFVFSIFFLVFAGIANPEEEQDDSQSRTINVYRKTFHSQAEEMRIRSLSGPRRLSNNLSFSETIRKQSF